MKKFITKKLYSNRVLICILSSFSLIMFTACDDSVRGSSTSNIPKRYSGLKVDLTQQHGEGELLAKVGSQEIHSGDLQSRLLMESEMTRRLYTSQAGKKKYLEKQLRFELLAQEAIALNYHQRPDIVLALKKMIVQELSKEKFENSVKDSDITVADLQKYYDQHLSDFHRAAKQRASVVVVPFGENKSDALKQIQKIQVEARKDVRKTDVNYFNLQAKKWAQGSKSYPQIADLRFLSKADYIKMYGEQIAQKIWHFAEKNSVSEVIEGTDAYLVFKLTGLQQAVKQEFSKVKSQIRIVLKRQLKMKNFDAYMSGLEKKFKVQRFGKALEKIQIKTSNFPHASKPLNAPKGSSSGASEQQHRH